MLECAIVIVNTKIKVNELVAKLPQVRVLFKGYTAVSEIES